MSRPFRIDFPGACDHLTAGADRQEPIYRDAEGRTVPLDIVGVAMDGFDAGGLAYCQRDNHHFNRRDYVAGLRFQSILVDRDFYLLALCR